MVEVYLNKLTIMILGGGCKLTNTTRNSKLKLQRISLVKS